MNKILAWGANLPAESLRNKVHYQGMILGSKVRGGLFRMTSRINNLDNFEKAASAAAAGVLTIALVELMQKVIMRKK